MALPAQPEATKKGVSASESLVNEGKVLIEVDDISQFVGQSWTHFTNDGSAAYSKIFARKEKKVPKYLVSG